MNVNPIHFFNERGHSTMSADHLHAENKRLQEEIEHLERVNRSLATRLAQLASPEELDEMIYA